MGKVNRSRVVFLFQHFLKASKELRPIQKSLFLSSFSFSHMSRAWKCTDTLGNVSTVWEKHLQCTPWTTRSGVRKKHVGAEAADNKRKTRSELVTSIQPNCLSFKLPLMLYKKSKSHNVLGKTIFLNGDKIELRAHSLIFSLSVSMENVSICFAHHPL